MNDINCYSSSHHQHLHDLSKGFSCLRLSGLKLHPKKTKLFKSQLKFLGFVVTKDEIKTDEDKIKKIISLPQPKTITQTHSFIGACSYYCQYIKNFAVIAQPLHDQMKSKEHPLWGEKETEAFETLKKALCTALILISVISMEINNKIKETIICQ